MSSNADADNSCDLGHELFVLVGSGAVLGAVSALVLLRLGVLQRIDVRLMLAGIVIGFLTTQLVG